MKVLMRHGIASSCDAMERLQTRFGELEQVGGDNVDNSDYCWRQPVVNSGLELAEKVLDQASNGPTLLVGHSQGGLVCRVAAVALTGQHRGGFGKFTREIVCWKKKHVNESYQSVPLAVVMIATPNCGALSLGQMSVCAEMAARFVHAVLPAARLYDLIDLSTPRLFREFENWRVKARYLSISGALVNRFRRGLFDRVADFKGTAKFAIHLEKPNDGVVEDSSTDLRQSLIPPEVDLERCYRHVRTYRNSIELGHWDVHSSADVFEVITSNLDWLCGG